MTEKDMHHGKHWTGSSHAGWFISEKYRGARAFWDGETLWSRGGNAIALPDEWKASLPKGIPLDGEVWLERGPEGGRAEVAAAAAVTRSEFCPGLRFIVFDAPNRAGNWAERMEFAASVCSGVAQAVPFVRCKGLTHIESEFFAVASRGGEGLMLRNPLAEYEVGRTGNLRKVKIDPAVLRGVIRFAA